MTLVTCYCSTCGGGVEFEDQDAGRKAPCPHCQNEIELIIPPRIRAITVRPSVMPVTTPPITIAQSTIVCSYILAIVVPVVGVLFGIYLMTQKSHGHGLVCIGLSIFSGVIFMAMLNS